MIKHDLKDTVCNTTDVRDKNRILLDAVCAHLSSTPQDYAVFRKCALQIHPFLECLLPSECCLSCVSVEDEKCDISPKDKKKQKEVKTSKSRKRKKHKQEKDEEGTSKSQKLDEECDASYKKRIKKKPMKDKQEEDEEEHERKLKSPKLGVDNGNPVILQSSDLSKVFEKTKSACKKWKAIGRWLGFKKDELSSMVHADGNTRREDFYETMLSLWLDWAPPYHSFPTVQQLSQALYEVNNKKQAFDLNDAYGMSA